MAWGVGGLVVAVTLLVTALVLIAQVGRGGRITSCSPVGGTGEETGGGEGGGGGGEEEGVGPLRGWG